MSNYRVGSNIDAWCTRCRLMLAHTIEAALGREIKRVHCNTCLSKHQYRAAPPGQIANGKRPVKTASAGAAQKKKESHWARLLKEYDTAKALPYNVKTEFSEGGIVAHLQFGFGIVTEVKENKKIEVLFQEGPKVLMHNRV